MKFSLLALIVAAALGTTLGPSARAADVAAEKPPAEALSTAIEGYSPATAATTKQAVADAFFEFEGSSLDRDLGARQPKLYREIEGEWMRLMSAIEAGKPAEEIRSQTDGVLALLERGRKASEAGGSIFFDSFLIILREGFEAILIVSALAAYLARIGQKNRTPYLYGGSVLAIGASVLLWIATRNLFDLGGAGREAVEGWTILVATAVLFWVSYWLVSKAEATRWQAFVKSQVDRAIGRGALFGLGFLSFIVVFREGLETVLFYEAIAARSSGASDSSLLLSGFLSGCVALGVLWVGFQKLGPKIPMRAFFNVTGGLLYFMAFRFAGAGVRELQEAQVMDQTPVGFFAGSDFAEQWLGIYPYVEPLVFQAVLVGLALFALFYTFRASSRPPVAEPAPAKRRVVAGS